MIRKQVKKTHPAETTTSYEKSIWRPWWFLVTRCFAVLGVALALIISRNGFAISTINYRALWILVLILLVTNVLYYLYFRIRLQRKTGDDKAVENRLSRFTKIQINIDLIILTFMLHFGGGATNPFILYYFFHTILSSILLSKLSAYIEASVAIALFSSMTALEGYDIIPHYNLFSATIHTKPIFTFGMISAMASALYIAVYMATSIMDRLHMHRRELEKSLEEIRRLEEEKSRFLDIVAHDLKSPLAAIETMVNSALSVYKDSMTTELMKILERIPNRTQDLMKFTQDLLEFSRISKIEEIKTQFKPLNFLPIVTATIEMYMAQALDKNIKMTVQSAPHIPSIVGSKDHLERMVSNLVSNAIRYTPENGSVTVKIDIENNEVVLTVADTGIGIPEQVQPHIFTEFFRANNAKKMTASGTGLGLSITKAIVEQHGGIITFKSEVGEGTVFTVRLPVASH